MKRRIIETVLVLGLIALAVGLVLNCTGGGSNSPCSSYCRQQIECEGGGYYNDYYYGENGSSVLEQIQCVDGCNDIRDDDSDLYDCLVDCSRENDCDDFSQCAWECEPYYYYYYG